MSDITGDWLDSDIDQLIELSGAHGWNALFILKVMMSESGARTTAHNLNGHASGLIQFMPDTLVRLGWSRGHEAFRAQPVSVQLEYVERYYSPYVRLGLDSPARFYLATFLPALLSRPGSRDPAFILCARGGQLEWAYEANRVFDRESKGNITLGDLATAIDRACHSARWTDLSARLEERKIALGLLPTEPPTEQDAEVVYDEPPFVVSEPYPEGEVTKPEKKTS